MLLRAAFLALVLSCIPASATTYLWSNGSGTWSTGPWQPAGTPGAADSVLISATGALTVDQSESAASFTTVNDFSGQTAQVSGPGPLTLSASGTLGTVGGGAFNLVWNSPLLLGGSSATLQSAGGSAFTLGTAASISSAFAGPVALNVANWSNNTIYLNGSITDGASADLGGLRIVLNNFTTPLQIGGTNTATGGIVIAGTSATVLKTNNNWALGSGTLVIGGFGAKIDTASVFTNAQTTPQAWNADFLIGASYAMNFGSGAITLNASRTVCVAGGGSVVIGGPIGESATGSGLTFGTVNGTAPASNASLSLSGSCSYSGPTVINGGNITFTGANGSARGSTGFTVNSGGTLTYDNSASSGTNGVRFGSAPVNLAGGAIVFNNPGDNAAYSGTVAQLNFGGVLPAAITVAAAGSSGTSLLNVGTMSHTAGAFVSASLPSSGATRNKILIGNGTGLLVNGLIPWMLETNAGAFATYNASTGLQALTAFNTNNEGSTWVSGSNIKRTSSTTLSASRTINSFTLSGGSSLSLNLSSYTLTLTSGAILTTGNTPAITGGTLAFGSAEAVFDISTSTATVSSNLTGSGGLTKAGTGTLLLTGLGSALSGPVSVNAGVLQIGNGSAVPLGLSGSVTIASGASLVFNSTVSGTLNKGVTGAGTLTNSNTTGALTLVQPAGCTGTIGHVTATAGAVIVLGGDATANTTLPDITGASGALLKFTGGTWNIDGNATVWPNIELDGGVLNSFSSYWSMNQTGLALTVHGGVLLVDGQYGLNLGNSSGANAAGSSFTGIQDGGLVNMTTSADSVQIGSTNAVTCTYALTGGTFYCAGAMNLGASVTGTGLTRFTLGGTGRLFVQGTLAGSQGPGAQQIFSFTGGTLVAAAIDATKLSGTAAPSVTGTFYNTGGTLAPGDTGIPGLLAITGGYSASGGTLAIDIGGIASATAFQSGSGCYDFVSASGPVVLGGTLAITLSGGYVPSASATYTVLTGASVSGAFANVAFGSRVATADGKGTFLVSLVNNSVVLSNFIWTSPSPAVVLSPVNQDVMATQTALFSASAAAIPAPTVQWYVNSGTGFALVAGGTASALSFTADASQNGWIYEAIFTGTNGATATTGTASLRVRAFWDDTQNVAASGTGMMQPNYNFSGIYRFSPPPAIGIHPRIFFNPEDLTEIRNRLRTLASGSQAMAQIRAYNTLLQLGWIGYNSNASYARDPGGNVRIGNTGYWDASGAYQALAAGDGTQISGTDSGKRYTLGGAMAMEAFECVINADIDPVGTAARQAVLATAMTTWANAVVNSPNLTYNNRDLFGGEAMAIAYDLNFNAMTTAQRDICRQCIVKTLVATNGYYGYGLQPQATTSNWAGLNTFQAVTMLALEGETGWDATQFAGFMNAYQNFISYGYFPSGAIFEGEGKGGFFGANAIAFAKRGYSIFAHQNVRANATRTLPAELQPWGRYSTGWDTLGGSGQDPVLGGWKGSASDAIAFKYVYASDPAVDFVWRNYTAPDGYYDYAQFGTNGSYGGTLVKAAIFCRDCTNLQQTWTDANQIAQPGLTYSTASDRGLIITRSALDDTDAMQLHFHCRQEFGGHTYADRNTFLLSALGRVWIRLPSDTSSYSDSMFQNIPLIDGTGIQLSPQEGTKARQPGKIAAVIDNPLATFATGDATYAYNWQWKWSGTVPLSSADSTSAPSGWTKVTETFNNFLQQPLSYSYLNTPFYSFPAWDTPGMAEGMVKAPFNTMRHVYRTAGLVRNGSRPYAVIVDDICKDNALHTYSWQAQIPDDVSMISTSISANGQRDIVLSGSSGPERLLIRFVREIGTPVPAATGTTVYDANHSTRRLLVSTTSSAPNWIAILYPYLDGEPLPTTAWSGSQLSVTLSATAADTFTFQPRTALVTGTPVTMTEFLLTRNGARLADTRNSIQPIFGASNTVLLSATPVAGGSLTGAGTYVSGTTVTVTATPASGYQFLNWTSGGSIVATSASFSFALSASASLVANFVPTRFDTWCAQQFTPVQLGNPAIGGTFSNPSGDGISNLLKYALNANPNVANRGALPVISTTGGALSMFYTVNAWVSDLAFAPEVSGDMMTWFSGAGYTTAPVVTGSGSGTVTCWVSDLTHAGPGVRRFIRLRVTKTP